jgi:prepilin-type N-terminal cleavage/methylation domain-containing protein
MKIDPNLKKQAVKRGFTLIELIASIAIVTIITALAVTRYSLVISSGRAAKEVSVVNAVDKAKDMYLSEDARTIADLTAFNAKAPEDRLAELLPYIRLNGLPVTAGSMLLEGTGRTSIDPGLVIAGSVTATGGITLR